MLLSRSPYLQIVAGLLALFPVLLGLNGMLRPRSAFALFQFQLPVTEEGKQLVDSLIVLYGVRDVFMGLAILFAVCFGTRSTAGYLFLLSVVVAIVDGIVSRSQIGSGEWNHWAFAPIPALLGLAFCGAFDSDRKAKHS